MQPDISMKMLIMAQKDLKALRSLQNPASCDVETFGFLAQQAVEKLLKSLCAHSSGHVQLTHNLYILFNLVLNDHPFLAQYRELCVVNPFAVKFRYEPCDLELPELDRPAIIASIESLLGAVEKATHPPEKEL